MYIYFQTSALCTYFTFHYEATMIRLPDTATCIFTTKRPTTRVGTLIVETIYLQLIQNRYTFRSFTVLQCSHQHCVQPIASDVEVVGYL